MHVLWWKITANFYLGLLSKKEKKNQPGMRIEMQRLLGCNEYFLVVSSEGAWNRCKSLSQSDISWIRTPQSWQDCQRESRTVSCWMWACMTASLPSSPRGRETTLLGKKREGEEGKKCLKLAGVSDLSGRLCVHPEVLSSCDTAPAMPFWGQKKWRE